jgi:hypothetical protein
MVKEGESSKEGESKEKEYERLLLGAMEKIEELKKEAEKRRRKPKFPDPEVFKGARERFKDFETQTRLKLMGDKHLFEDESEKIFYIIGRLQGDPAEWAKMYYIPSESKKLKVRTADEFIQELQKAFGDPDEKGSAERELQRLKQNGGPVATYWAQLRRLSTVLSLDDVSTRIYFLTGLDQKVKEWLATQIDQGSWDLQKLINNITMYDNQARQLQALSRPRYTTPSFVQRPQATNSSTPGNTTTSQPRTSLPYQPNPTPRTFTQAASQGYYGQMPMEVDRARTSRISPEERERRLRDGCCFRCGRKGHFSYQCTPQDRAQAPPPPPPKDETARQGRQVRDYRRIAAMEREVQKDLEEGMGGVSLGQENKDQGKE